MIRFVTELGNLYSRNLEYYEILLSKNAVNVYIKIDQGQTEYEIISKDGGYDELVTIRDQIDQELEGGNCKISEDKKNKCIYFNDTQFKGQVLVADFLPN